MGITELTCPTCQRVVDVSTTRCVFDETQLNCINTDPVLRLRYDHLEQLAAGGMGQIYKAHDVRNNLAVAIKTMHFHVITPHTVERFQMEVKATSRLSHPNIIAIRDYGLTASGQPYLAMDYLQGESLSDLLKKESTLDRDSFFTIFSQVCQALAHAHNRSILHRDIKPGNIMLTFDQANELHATLLDFGIARVLGDEEYEKQKMTKTGDVIGSPAYMSPEQARGGKVDHRSDIYSLGCVMYETLAGVPPFFGRSSLETILMHKTEAPLPMSEASLGKKVDPELENFVLHLLEKNPDDRYQSMTDIDRDLLLLKSGGSLEKKAAVEQRHGSYKAISMPVIVGSAFLVVAGIVFAFTQNFWLPKAPPGTVPRARLRDQDFHFDKLFSTEQIQALVRRNLEQHNPFLDLTFVQTPVTNQDLAALKDATFLAHIMINNATIDDDGLQALSHLPLEELRLRSSKVKNLNALKDMKKITQLDLQDSPVDASGVRAISHLPDLEDLNLSGTPLHDQDLKPLYTMKKLRSLELSNCANISQSAIERLRKTLRDCKTTSETTAGSNSQLRQQEQSLVNHGLTLVQEGNYERACEQFQKAIAVCRHDQSPDKSDLAYALSCLADGQANLHRYKEATDSYREALKQISRKSLAGSDEAQHGIHLAAIYERWNLADADQNALKAAAAARVQSEQAATLAEQKVSAEQKASATRSPVAENNTVDERLSNLLILAHDYVLQKDYKKAAQTYKQFSDMPETLLPKTLLQKMADALEDESHAGKASLANAIVARNEAEEVFHKPGFTGSSFQALLHAHNLERLGGDLIPDDYDQALAKLDQAVSDYERNQVVLSADFLGNLEKAADYHRAKHPSQALRFYKVAQTAYKWAGREADAVRLEKKIAASKLGKQ